jgi:hypothetical protein
MLIRMKTDYAQPAVQICADVHFSVLIRTGVSSVAMALARGREVVLMLSIIGEDRTVQRADINRKGSSCKQSGRSFLEERFRA